MDFLKDVVAANDLAHSDIGKFILQFTLPPKNIQTAKYSLDKLTWASVKYGKDEIDKVPDDKRGIYAFTVHQLGDVLPHHGYVLYIGIAGRKSKRSLRARYKEYLNPKAIMKRESITRMIADWHPVLKFFYAPIEDDVSSETLEDIEKQLNSALMPPFSKGDLEAETKAKKRAFP